VRREEAETREAEKEESSGEVKRDATPRRLRFTEESCQFRPAN
jgi:hypothetical protein